MRKILYIVLFFGAWARAADAADDDVLVTLGPTFLLFDYTEFTPSGDFFNGEEGLLPGITATYRAKINKADFIKLDARFYMGEVDYDGFSQSLMGGPLIPAESETDTIVFDGYAVVGRQFKTTAGKQYDLYAGAGYRWWRRDINPTIDSLGNNVSGLLEYYDWFYVLAGSKINLKSGNVIVDLDIRATYMMAAEIEVVRFAGTDTKVLDLGERFGFYLGLPIRIKSAARSWIVEPYYEYIDIGRSNSAPLTVNGVPIGCCLVEPRSETRNIGVNIRFIM